MKLSIALILNDFELLTASGTRRITYLVDSCSVPAQCASVNFTPLFRIGSKFDLTAITTSYGRSNNQLWQ